MTSGAVEYPEQIWATRPSFVGRQRELGRLRARLDGALAGQGGIVLVGGEPGIGKTRLLTELAEEARAGGWLVLWGRAYDGEGMLAYLPFAEALREYVRSCPLGHLQEQLGDGAADVALMMPEIQRRLKVLAPRPALSPEHERYRLFESISDFLLAIAGVGGLLLVLDDLHWADTPTLLLLQHLARRLGPAPLLVAGAYRTVGLDRHHPLQAVLAAVRREGLDEQLLLSPLKPEEAADLAERMAGAAPAPAVLKMLYRETAGNPLFLSEVVQSLCEDGRDLTDPSVTGERWPIPEGVRQVIGSRLARLSPAAFQILQVGAVLGDGFAIELLAPACALAPAAFLDALDEVVQAGFWREQNEGYHFAHPLIREVLYNELSLPRRQQLHLRAAEAIERICAHEPADHLPALALHYRLAGPAADPQKSIHYAVQAGEAAAAAFAWEDAAAQWQTALRLLKRHGGEPERRAELFERLGTLMLASRLDLFQGIGYLEEALKLWRALRHENAAARTQVWLGRCYLAHPSDSKDVPRALAFYQEAQAVLDRGPEGLDLGYLYLGLSQAASYLLRSDEALGAGRRAVAIGTRLGDVALRSEAATRCANALSRCGRLAEAEVLYEEAWGEADRSEIATICFTITENRSEHAWDLGDPRAALRRCLRELERRQRTRPPALTRRLQHFLARFHVTAGDVVLARAALGEDAQSDLWLAFAEGRWEQAQAMTDAELQRHRRSGSRLEEWLVLSASVALALALRDSEAAERTMLEMLSLLEYGNLSTWEMVVLPGLALRCARTGHREAAQAHLARCREILAAGEDWRGLAGRVALAAAAVAADSGRRTEADALFTEAIVTFQRFSLPWEEAGALELWASMAGGARRGADADERFDAAVTIYRRIGAGQRWIERVDELRRSAAPRTHAHPDALTAREVEVLRLLASGLSNAEIAATLVLSGRTVERHIETIYRKIGARGKAARTVAAAYAHRRGVAGD